MSTSRDMYPNEAPPAYAANDLQPKAEIGSEPPKHKWWSRKRILMPTSVFVMLLIMGIVLGAVLGSKAARENDYQRHQEQLFAGRFSNSSSWPSTPTPTRWSSYSYTPTPASSGWYPGISRTPSPTPGGDILQPQTVPRDISIAAGVPGLVSWYRAGTGWLWTKVDGGSWGQNDQLQFMYAPVSVRTGESTQTAVSVDFLGSIVYMQFQDGQWGEWQTLEFTTRFTRRPAVVSRAEGRLDIMNVNNEGHVWIVSYDGSSWSEWTHLGYDITSELSATTWGEDRIDVFGKRGKTVMHKAWAGEAGWSQWEDLGDPFANYYYEPYAPPSSAPLAVSWRDGDNGVIEVLMVNKGGSHKTFRDGAWRDWTSIGASHEGYEFPDTASMVNGDAVDGRPFAHLVIRGTDTCVHYKTHNGTDWESWFYIFCEDRDSDTSGDYPTEFLPTYMVNSGEGKVEVVLQDLTGNFRKLQIVGSPSHDDSWDERNEKWESFGIPV